MFKTLTRLSRMLILSEKDVRQCLLTKDCIDINRKALASLKTGKGVVPTRLGLSYEDNSTTDKKDEGIAKDWTFFKPAAYYGEGDNEVYMGMKLVSVRAGNPAKGKPLVPATVMVVNAESGMAEALMGGTYLTGARTAAGSAIATQLCCTDPKRLVVFGAGLQAECHIDSIQTVQPSVNHVTIVNRTAERAQSLVKKLTEDTSKNVEYDMVLLSDKDAVRDAVGKADVIATTTNTTTPLWDGSWLKKGCHINGVGSYTSEMQEVDEESVKRSKVLFDTQEALNVGDLQFLSSHHDHPKALLGEVLENKNWLRQETAASVDCTFFKSVGTAIQDVMTAQVVLQRAQQLNLGQELDMT